MLLSNVIKPSKYIPLLEKKTIKGNLTTVEIPVNFSNEKLEPAELNEEVENAKTTATQILKDAEYQAELLLQQSMEEARLLKSEAEEEIARWWDERRSLDEEHIENNRSRGYEIGYEEGLSTAESEIQLKYANKIAEAQTIIKQAHNLSQQIIQEAEPFLIDLSCEIAEKIVDRELHASPDWMLDLIKKLLSRRREQGLVTLCVSPAHFDFVHNAREQLLLALDSQAELQILPDANIADHGCVIRTSFGSIDGRIDMQLQEIKTALKQFATQSRES